MAIKVTEINFTITPMVDGDGNILTIVSLGGFTK